MMPLGSKQKNIGNEHLNTEAKELIEQSKVVVSALQGHARYLVYPTSAPNRHVRFTSLHRALSIFFVSLFLLVDKSISNGTGRRARLVSASAPFSV
jgi:hypothetical protein